MHNAMKLLNLTDEIIRRSISIFQIIYMIILVSQLLSLMPAELSSFHDSIEIEICENAENEDRAQKNDNQSEIEVDDFLKVYITHSFWKSMINKDETDYQFSYAGLILEYTTPPPENC